MNKAIERKIQNIYNEVFKKIYTRRNYSRLAKGSRVEILETAQMLENSEAYNKFAKKFAVELAKRSLATKRGVWRKYYAAAKRLHYVALPKTWNAYEISLLSKAVKENFKMIKTIPSKTIEICEHKYTSILIEEVAKGRLSRGSFRAELEKHKAKNAKMIARTETSKLQSQMIQNRATDLGSVAYIWRASNDKRTRQSHKEMNDVVVFWRQNDQKPLRDSMRGNAGEFPNCRCAPNPIIDTDDLKKSTYLVYDYLRDKIVKMNRADLIEALKRGYLE